MFFLGADFGEGDPLNGAHVYPQIKGPWAQGPWVLGRGGRAGWGGGPWALYLEVLFPYYSLVSPSGGKYLVKKSFCLV